MDLEGARDRLRVAAERRKKSYDQHVRDCPLQEGQLVRLCDFSAKGRHKIQDLWGSVVYQVVRAPREGGSVYTVAPIDDQTKTKQVHRTLLKAVVGASPLEGNSTSPHQSLGQPQSKDEMGDDLFARNEAPPVTPTHTVVTQAGPPLLHPQSAAAPTIPDPIAVPASVIKSAPSVHGAPPPATYPNAGVGSVRRTTRPTAGQHLNIHHLPRSSGEPARAAANVPAPASNAISALFRPWD